MKGGVSSANYFETNPSSRIAVGTIKRSHEEMSYDFSKHEDDLYKPRTFYDPIRYYDEYNPNRFQNTVEPKPFVIDPVSPMPIGRQINDMMNNRQPPMGPPIVGL